VEPGRLFVPICPYMCENFGLWAYIRCLIKLFSGCGTGHSYLLQYENVPWLIFPAAFLVYVVLSIRVPFQFIRRGYGFYSMLCCMTDAIPRGTSL